MFISDPEGAQKIAVTLPTYFFGNNQRSLVLEWRDQALANFPQLSLLAKGENNKHFQYISFPDKKVTVFCSGINLCH